MRKIIFATNNEGKMKEIRMIMSDLDVEIITMKEARISIDIVEDGKTFEENAKIKAKAVSKLTDAIVLADDSGLEIDYLDKAPGVYSARFMGEDTSYDIKNNAILEKLKDVPEEERTARFVCTICGFFPDGSNVITRGTVEGIIGYEIKGQNGFGYDPIFYLPEFSCYSAELSPEQKNEVSHRGKALKEMKSYIEKWL